MSAPNRFNVREPSTRVDPLTEARREAERSKAEAERAIRQLEKMKADEQWAAEHIRGLADWQRDALYRLLERMQHDG